MGMKQIMRIAAFAALSVLIASGLSRPSAAGEGPVVVELFTSQGCSSCPPADALLDELTEQPDVIALSFHVDYWDYIGWQDPFADPAYTQRQRNYRPHLGNRFIYTPQMVIDGHIDVVGSRREQVSRAIEEARADEKLPVSLSRDSVSLPAGTAPKGGATVWIAFLDERHETQVGAGENGGRKLVNSHVVRKLSAIGTWKGEALSIPLAGNESDAGRYGCAVLVQENGSGRILGAAFMTL